MAARKLYIYDRTSSLDQSQADGRFTRGVSRNGDIHTLPVSTEKELIEALDDLVRRNVTFDRVLFQTHGRPGGIWIDRDLITGLGLLNDFSRGYWNLFPSPLTKVYFDGCNVADGDAGWSFLIAAGTCFLRRAGGYVLGWTSLGTAMPGWLPFVGGHTVHFYGSLRAVQFAPGGLLMGQPDASARSRALMR
jgi:hypothetical protein